MGAKLTAHGDTFTIEVDRDIVEKWKINPDSELHMAVRDGALVVTPVKDDFEAAHRERVQKAGEAIREEFASVFKELAQ